MSVLRGERRAVGQARAWEEVCLNLMGEVGVSWSFAMEFLKLRVPLVRCDPPDQLCPYSM